MKDLELVEALEDIEEGLNEWELSFVVSLGDWVRAPRALSTLQRGKAEEILERF